MMQLSRRSFLAHSLILVNGVPLSALAQATPVTNTLDDGLWWRGALFYEVFVRAFQDSDGDGIGDFAGLIARLDHLNSDTGNDASLGVQALWLMPIMASPSYHGYDVTDYETVNPNFGTNHDFKALVDALHSRDMRVIIDYPINHTSVEHPWFIEAASDPASPKRDWYIFAEENPGYLGPWGQQVWHSNPHGSGYYYGIFDSGMPDLNFRNAEVNAEVHRITEFWLTEMGVDGFRMDAIKHVIESGQIQEGTPETIEWIRTFANWVREIKPDAFTVGEVMGSGTDGLQPYYPDTLDAYFHFQLAQEIVNGANFGNAVKITNFVKGAVERLPDQRWGTFLTNHDQERIASTLKGDMGKLGVAAMIMLSLPGIPFMYYGEEIGMQGTKPDPNIRTPMQWSTEAHGGFTTGIPFTPPQSDWETVNVELQSNDPSSLLTLYRTWGTARANHEAIRIGDYQALDTDQRSVMAFTRSTAGQSVLVVINMGKTESEPVHLSPGEGISLATSALDGTVIEVNGEIDLGIMPAQSGGIWVLS